MPFMLIGSSSPASCWISGGAWIRTKTCYCSADTHTVYLHVQSSNPTSSIHPPPTHTHHHHLPAQLHQWQHINHWSNFFYGIFPNIPVSDASHTLCSGIHISPSVLYCVSWLTLTSSCCALSRRNVNRPTLFALWSTSTSAGASGSLLRGAD